MDDGIVFISSMSYRAPIYLPAEEPLQPSV